MKTKTIKLKKKEVLVIELPINGYWEVLSTETRFKCFDTGEKLILKNYTLLGKPDEITEDDVMDLVDTITSSYSDGTNESENFKHYKKENCVAKTAIKSFNSAIEKELLWVNPFNYEKTKFEKQCDELSICRIFNIEEQKNIVANIMTFDKSRTLIFVKN